MTQMLFTFFLSQSAIAGCLIDHLKEGIELNEKRKVIYSEMSAGTTAAVSDTLINYEYNLIYLVKLTRFEKKFSGLETPYFCEEFQSTPNSLPPVYQSKTPDLRSFHPISFSDLKRKLQKIIQSRDLSHLHTTLDQEIHRLQKEPRFNCMTRHLLESMARVSWLALIDHQKTDAALQLLKYMPIALYGSKQLDVMAAEHQVSGIPILCHDLPLIIYK